MDSATIHFIGLVLFTTQVMGPGPEIRPTQTHALVSGARVQETRAATEGTTQAPAGTLRLRVPEPAVQPEVPSPASPAARPVFITQPVVAILPRVLSGDTAVPAPPIGTQARKALLPAARGHAHVAAKISIKTPVKYVEDHTALIAFEPADMISVAGWTVQSLGNSRFKYIELTGEQISFVANGVNGIAIPDARLGSAGGSQLKAAYQPPYDGAAAVFMIPRGALSACTSSTAPGRIDTKLSLSNHGTLTIQAAGKSLLLHGNARVLVANVPFPWAASRTQTHSDIPHYKVYCDMTGNAECDFEKMKPRATAGQPPSCNEASMKIAGQVPRPESAATWLDKAVAVDVFCSNSAWP